MKIKRLGLGFSAVALTLAATVVPLGSAWADDTAAGGSGVVVGGCDIENMSCVSTLEAFRAAINNPEISTIRLDADIVLTSRIVIMNGREVTIDLNNHSITPVDKSFDLFAIWGAKVKVTGTGTIGSETGASAFMVAGHQDDATAAGFSTLYIDKDVTLKADDYVIYTDKAASRFSHSYGVVVDVYGKIVGRNAFYIQGVLQDVADTAPIYNIHDGAEIEAASFLAYGAGYGHWSFGKITAKTANGLGIKAGTYELKDTVITANGEYKDPAAWGNGINGVGAAIQIESNDAYADNVEILIDGGTYTSTNSYAFFEYKASADTKNTVKELAVYGGTFKSGEGKDVFKVSDGFSLTKFVSGGVFSDTVYQLPPKYIADGYEAVSYKSGSAVVAKSIGSADATDTDETEEVTNESKMSADGKFVTDVIIKKIDDVAEGTKYTAMGDSANVSYILTNKAALEETLAKGYDLFVVLTEPEKLSAVSEAEAGKVNAKLDEKAVIAGVYDVNVELLSTLDAKIGNITETSKELDVTIDLSDATIAELKDGYSRKWTVVRYHDGEVEELDAEYDAKNNTIKFKSAKFSDFTVAYVDELDATPNTGMFTAQSVGSYEVATTSGVMALISTVIVMYGAVKFAKN